MGFMSRRVVPACGSFCVCCPSLRSRSRQPVKRYKTLIADVFQEELPNDRKISKLCDYASRNPLRIPKIAASLEQRGYKELRNERFGSMRIVMAAYIKLFSACKAQLPLFAASAINLMKTLLEQTQHDDMRVVGCDALIEFAYNQVDGTYIHQLDALLPSVCSLARESRGQRQMQQRSAGLRALSALIWFMGEHSYMPSAYDQVISAIMENYESSSDNEDSDGKGDGYQYWVNEVIKQGGRVPMSTLTDAFIKLPSQKEDLIIGKLPSIFARICIEKIAQFAKEVTTARRFLEPIFCYFDLGKHWASERGLASVVLHQFLNSIENFGSDSVLLPLLIRHVDHKNVNQRPQVKADIIKIFASLVRKSRSEATVLEIGILNDILRHLCNSFENIMETSDSAVVIWNKELQSAIQECLQGLAAKLGNPVPIYEMMALNLEKLSSVGGSSRSMISALMVLVHVVVSLPQLMQLKQSLPEALIHQLALAMVHSDSETRIGVHNIFGTLFIPSSMRDNEQCVSSASGSLINDVKKQITTSAAAFNSVNLMLETLRKSHCISEQSAETSTDCKSLVPDGNVCALASLQKQEKSKIDHTGLHKEVELTGRDNQILDREGLELTPMKLTGDQATLLLTSIWSELNMDDNSPSNYAAIFSTFSLVLLFSPSMDSDHNVFVQVVQLTLSLRNMALTTNSHLYPPRQRSLFILSMAMLVFTSRIYNIQGITSLKDTLVQKGLIDPFLGLDGHDLRAAMSMDSSMHASSVDVASASEFLSAVRAQNEISTESIVSLILSSMSSLFGIELDQVREELLQPFSPDKGLAFSLDIKLNKAIHFDRNKSFDEVVEPNEDLVSDISHTDVPQFLRTPVHTLSANVIGVSQLLESALEAAGQVAGVSIASSPLPYSDVAMRCEAFGTNAGRKIPVWMNLGGSGRMNGHRKESKGIDGKYVGYVNKSTLTLNPLYISNHENWETLQLPPVSHYDNFLRAAGC